MVIVEPALFWEGESWQHFCYPAVMMELEVIGSGLLPDCYHRFPFSVAANSKTVCSFTTGSNSASFVPPIALQDR